QALAYATAAGLALTGALLALDRWLDREADARWREQLRRLHEHAVHDAERQRVREQHHDLASGLLALEAAWRTVGDRGSPLTEAGRREAARLRALLHDPSPAGAERFAL